MIHIQTSLIVLSCAVFCLLLIIFPKPAVLIVGIFGMLLGFVMLYVIIYDALKEHKRNQICRKLGRKYY